MDSNSWSFRFSNSSSSSSSSRRHQSQSGYDEDDEDKDFKAEFICPFCAEDFDVVGLSCHIDEEHPVEAKNGVCPVCAKMVRVDTVSHITMQHWSFIKHKRRLRKGGLNLTFSILRKELREGHLPPLFGGSSCIVSSSSIEPDPLLSSFMFNPPTNDEPLSLQPLSIAESTAVKESTNKEFLERRPQPSQLSDKDHKEKARRCEFVQGLLMFTILDDNFQVNGGICSVYANIMLGLR